MSKGVVLFANNNSTVEYTKMAYYCALQIRKHLNLPVTLVTNSKDYLLESLPDAEELFDQIINVWDIKETGNTKRYYDGSLYHTVLEFRNGNRSSIFDISPYEETIVMDTDYIVKNDLLLQVFKQPEDLLIYKNSFDLSGYRDIPDFKRVVDTGIDFYWATVFYFKKTETTKLFFDLINHIQENWYYYLKLYNINHALTFRNDYAFSIAIHIMQGYTTDRWINELPSKMYFTLDKDILWKSFDDGFIFLVEKENYLGEYTPIRTKDLSVHIMNKVSLMRIINEELNV